MQCPYCGADLDAGSIYCKACGHELQIVPDYDPLEEVLIGQDKPSKEVTKKEKRNTPPHVEDNETLLQAGKRSTTKAFPKFLLLSVLLSVGFLVFLIAYFSMTKENSYDYQLKKGIEYYKKEQYEDALSCLKQAQKMQANMEGADIEPLRYLALTYLEMDAPDMAVSYMEDAIILEASARGNHYALEELLLEYMELLNQAGETSRIDSVIAACPYPELQETLKPYRIAKPTADKPEGEYGYYIKLELDAKYGSIYYTLDGTEPTAESTRYEGPISLEEGETLLSAVAINKKGMVSDKLVLVYKLNFDKNTMNENEEEYEW